MELNENGISSSENIERAIDLDNAAEAEKAKDAANKDFKGAGIAYCKTNFGRLCWRFVLIFPKKYYNLSTTFPNTAIKKSFILTVLCLSVEKHYSKAVAGYTTAIELNPFNAVYYSNRAAANIRLENYGSAVADATKALDVDPKYAKVYSSIRPGSA